MHASDETVQCSVVIPTFRGSNRLPRLLTSLQAQSYDGRWEVVVALDGEDSDTRAVLENHTAGLPLRIVTNHVPQGVASAMNLGIEEARGRIVIRCDDDLLLEPDFLAKHMHHHKTSGLGIISATRDVFPIDNTYGKLYGESANLRALQATYRRTEKDSWIAWAACNSVERKKLIEVGGFNPRLPYGEDSELGYRLKLAGVKITADKELEVGHLAPAFGLETRIPRAFISGASKKAFRALHPGILPVNESPSNLSEQAWSAATALMGNLLSSPGRCLQVAKLASPLMRVMPPSIASKMIALLVESAALGGAKYGSEDISIYKTQKSEDIRREGN